MKRMIKSSDSYEVTPEMESIGVNQQALDVLFGRIKDAADDMKRVRIFMESTYSKTCPPNLASNINIAIEQIENVDILIHKFLYGEGK